MHSFYDFLLVSEFTCSGMFNPSYHLALADVRFDHRGFYSIFIKRSKTDPFAAGCTIYFESSGQSICLSWLFPVTSPCVVMFLVHFSSFKMVVRSLLLLLISGSDRSFRQQALWATTRVTVFVLGRLPLPPWGAFPITLSRSLVVGQATRT